jgi:hypothetical protein
MCAVQTFRRRVAAIELQPTDICLTRAPWLPTYGDSGIIQLHVIQEQLWKTQ